MKTIIFLLFISIMVSPALYAQDFYEDSYSDYRDSYMEDEGSFESELQPPVSDDYYLSEELERQEEYEFQDAPPADWNLEGEELPADDYIGY